GIRAFHVTGVQTCALPIYAAGQPDVRREAAPGRVAVARERDRRGPVGGALTALLERLALEHGDVVLVVARDELDLAAVRHREGRSEERRVGTEVSMRRSLW